ncbi:MAG: alpha/beta fold hydrolase [Alphaproteobacteria bacterium]
MAPAGAADPRRPPLLFVHGAFAGGQCWATHLMPACAAAGWRSHAFSLRGHGASPGDVVRDNYGLDAYLDDLVDEIDRLDRPPVLVGHSMGGWLAMRAATECAVAGLVLMCPVPPFGLASANLSLAVWNPLLAARIGRVFAHGDAAVDPSVMRETLFAGALPPGMAEQEWATQAAESLRAGIELQHPPRFDLAPLRGLPRLVLGAERDALIPPPFVHATAGLLEAEAEILPGLGHGLMLDHGWQIVADRLLGWLANPDNGLDG